jgi:hypothetical protein
MLDNRWKRRSDKGGFARVMNGLIAEATLPKTEIIDVISLREHSTSTSLRSIRGGQATKEAV